MKAILIVLSLFVAYLNAASIDQCSNYSLEKELDAINKTCLTSHDKQMLTGNVVKGFLNGMLYSFVMPVVQETIGLSEMRKALGFKKMGPWKVYRYGKPSEKQIENANGIEEYYELMEPKNMIRSSNTPILLEKNVIPNIGRFDERIPGIRHVYRCEFAEIMKRIGKIDRETVDKMIEKWTEISKKMNKATDVYGDHGDCEREEKQREWEAMVESAEEDERLAEPQIENV
ncbi:unnamed protein product [Caenorhabditis angaria]|uniref:Uncharacterized protein n=1 Tax=Caenorhabditis angaria TaxID=860376 RepID=A0A9P1I9D5_9PELO|nr:unnamed protein product [Caenorhabditis angaria]